jgi:hypothetical protein
MVNTLYAVRCMLYKMLYAITRHERQATSDEYMQNKPNLPDTRIYLTSAKTKHYENKRLCTPTENKPNLSRSSLLRSRIKPNSQSKQMPPRLPIKPRHNPRPPRRQPSRPVEGPGCLYRITSRLTNRQREVKYVFSAHPSLMVGVAQSDRALDCGSRGRGFESPLSPFF